MIPALEEILRMYKSGQCSIGDALNWIAQHQEQADLRDHFAGLALTAAAADELKRPTFDEATYKGTAVRAYLYADAMLEARKS